MRQGGDGRAQVVHAAGQCQRREFVVWKQTRRDRPKRRQPGRQRTQRNDALLYRAGCRRKAHEAQAQLAYVFFFGELQRAARSNTENARRQPQRQLAQRDTGQENDVVKNGRYLETVGQQPADLEDVLMQPAFGVAKEQDKQPQKCQQGEEIQVSQLRRP